jgi:catechol 2,3-dioxygenase-like lactoylglutathione lyase family enzyme
VFHHVTIWVADLGASERFYDTVLPTLGIDWRDSELSIEQQDGDHPVTREVHFGFRAPSRAAVDEFWRAGTAAGYEDDGPPGPRPQYTDDYYGSFLLDPDGHSAEAVHHGAMRSEGTIDHIWIRIPNIDIAKRFFAEITPHTGIRMVKEVPARATYAGDEGGSLTLITGRPTENLHMAFRGTVSGTRVDAEGNRVEIVS